MASPDRQLPNLPVMPDPFQPGYMDVELAAFHHPNQMYTTSLDVWTSPAPDARESPVDPLPLEDDLGPPDPRPQRDQRRAVREETRFIRVDRAIGGTVFELVRLKFARPGYLSRVATFLEVRFVGGGAVQYISNDLSDPDPFPISGLTVRWHLRQDNAVLNSDEAPFLDTGTALQIPSAHAVDGLPSVWTDMRYHWGQREPNKVARLRRPTNIRLFAELVGDVSTLAVRLGGQLGGWEGQK